MRGLAVLSSFFVAAGFLLTSPGNAAVTHNRLASNRLASNRLASNRLASNRLASNRLSTDGLSADMTSASELLSTADGREVYSYMMSCALPEGVSIEADIPGAPDSSPTDPPPYDTQYTCRNEHCVFLGALGLAPKWIDHKLNKKGQRWVSACLLARVNAYDTADAISLRGNMDVLAVNGDESLFYSVEEGAFYGQVFGPPDEPIEWYACIGRDQAQGESGGLGPRDCTEPDPDNLGYTLCGFVFTGPCADFDPAIPDPYACQSFSDDGFYVKCHVQPGSGKWPMIKKYKEVITTFVSN